jgi:hypothetical protein
MGELSRVTLVLPKPLWDKVKRLVPAGQRSRLVADALEIELRRRQRVEQVEEVKRFQAYMRGKYGQLPSSAPDIETVRQERDDEISRLH